MLHLRQCLIGQAITSSSADPRVLEPRQPQQRALVPPCASVSQQWTYFHWVHWGMRRESTPAHKDLLHLKGPDIIIRLPHNSTVGTNRLGTNKLKCQPWASEKNYSKHFSHILDIQALWFDRMEYESLLFISQLNWACACTDTRNQTQGEPSGFTSKLSSVCILYHISLSKQPDTQTVIPTSDTGKINFKKAKWPTQKS